MQVMELSAEALNATAERLREELPKQSREVFTGYRSNAEMTAAMDARRKELEAQGYSFVGRVKIGRNDPCPCQSGEKFKRCCIDIVTREGGATYVRLPLGEKDPKPTFQTEQVQP